MKCPACHFDNPGDTNFCGRCAAPLKSPDVDISERDPKGIKSGIAPGTVIAGKYRILSELGRGGMGEVYRADDLTLGRQVAVKVLPDVFREDSERLARFEREAKLLASLNHPNIASIYGIEEANGKRFFVLELVEGETLMQRIARGPLPVDEALKICQQIADGLDSAHEQGIIHRDLKPGNIKIGPEDTVKILDFGLAKAFHEEAEAADISQSPTLTDRMTQPGVILGTAAYMSPEQAKGKAVDKRTDIWAFGCVLFECLTGKKAFEGETISETLAAILKSEPDWTALPASTPPAVRRLLRRCFEKEAKRRLRDIGDALVEMDDGGITQDQEMAPVAGKPIPLGRIFIFAAAVVFIGILIYSLVVRPSKATSSSLVRSVVPVESGYSLGWMRRESEFMWPSRTALAISKDGSFLIYGAVNDDAGPDTRPQLFFRGFDKLKAEPIPGTEGGFAPFLSPDDRWIGFWVENEETENYVLKKISVRGGIAQDLCGVSFPFGASWGEDDTIVFAGDRWGGLSRISASGGEPEILTEPSEAAMESNHRLPFHLPQGKGVLFTIWGVEGGNPRIGLLEMGKKTWRILQENATDARYIRAGHLVFLREGTLMAVPFDLDNPYKENQPIPVITDVLHMLHARNRKYNTGAGQYSISDSGTLVYASGGTNIDKENELVWVDRMGGEELITAKKEYYFMARLSPSGRKIAYWDFKKPDHIDIYDMDRDISKPLLAKDRCGNPVWTEDGARIIFNLVDESVYWQLIDGSEEREPLIDKKLGAPLKGEPSSLSQDGEILALSRKIQDDDWNIFFYSLRTNEIVQSMVTDWNETNPEFSPEGDWIAYCSDEEGQSEVYVQAFPSGKGPKKISHSGGSHPCWARDGKSIFYRSIDMKQMWSVDIQYGTDLIPGTPYFLFDISEYGGGDPFRTYDLSLDGQRFLMVKTEKREPRFINEMVLIQNWFEELKRLVPKGK